MSDYHYKPPDFRNPFEAEYYDAEAEDIALVFAAVNPCKEIVLAGPGWTECFLLCPFYCCNDMPSDVRDIVNVWNG